MREQITTYLYSKARGNVHYSIEILVPLSDNEYGYDLIGGAYSLEDESEGAFTIIQDG